MTQYDYIVIGAGSLAASSQTVSQKTVKQPCYFSKRVIQIRNQKFKFRQST